MAEQQRTVTLRFNVEGDKQVKTAIVDIDKVHGKLQKTIISMNAQGEVLNKRITTYEQQLNKATAATSKHSAAIAGLVKLWISWNVASTVYNATLGKFIGYMQQAVKVSSDFNESANLTKVVLGGLKTDLDSWARTSSATLTQTINQTEAAVARFMQLGLSVGMGRRQAFEFAKTIEERTMDIGSLRNLTPEEANRRVYGGLTGEIENLKHIAISYTEAQVKQKAFEMGLSRTNKYADEQAKLLARVAIIMDQTNADAGDVVRTQYEWANIMRTVNARYLDFQSILGDNITQSQGWKSAMSELITLLQTMSGNALGAASSFDSLGYSVSVALAEMNVFMARASRIQAGGAAFQSALAHPFSLYGATGALGAIAATQIAYGNAGPEEIAALANLESAKARARYGPNIGPEPMPVLPGMQTIPGMDGGGGGGKAKKPRERSRFLWSRWNYPSDYNEALAASFLGNMTGFNAPPPDIGVTAAGPLYRGRKMRGGSERPSDWAGMAFAAMARANAHAEAWLPKPGMTNMQALRKGFGNDAMWSLGQQVAGGDFGGALGSAADIAGTALGWGPIGTIGKMLFGRGGLFGKGKKDVGLTPAQPIYTRDVGMMDLLTQLLNVTKGNLVGGTSAGINRQTMQLSMQGRRA